MKLHDLPSPALVVDADAFDRNVATMAAVWPGRSLRPHVKAFKSTAMARELYARGHVTFCCATPTEVEGMAAAGVGDDLMLANEVVGQGAVRMGELARRASVPIIVAVDSDPTLDAAVGAGVLDVIIDVNIGLPRCGADPAEAPRLAQRARDAGLTVHGVMGYEGHLMREPAETKAAQVEAAMAQLLAVHAEVGGPIITAGGTGTYKENRWATEIQAGSYTLMDTEYEPHTPEFAKALYVWGTCISVNPAGWAVVDVGLKSLGMDHGNPTVEGGDVWFVSDEHTTYGFGDARPSVGDRVRVWPAHVDPTVACHDRMHVVRDEAVVDVWDVDLRGWDRRSA